MNLRPVAVMVLLLTSSAALAAPRKAGRKSAVPPPPTVTAPASTPAAAEARTLLHGTQHVVFEGSELGGQGHKGAITIVERPELGMHSLLKQRANFRAELGEALR